MKFNWNQTGMPSALVSHPGGRNAYAAFKTVLNDAGNHVRRPVDAETLARGLAEGGGHELVEMVRELTEALSNAEKEREEANRRYERLVADLARRGIPLEEEKPPRPSKRKEPAIISVDDLLALPPKPSATSDAGSVTEWDEWDRKFRSLVETPASSPLV